MEIYKSRFPCEGELSWISPLKSADARLREETFHSEQSHFPSQSVMLKEPQ
jgi:hypothetical protein